ncbi:stalk domain-containing protein [Paenibacillus glycanilyticus]|uniref:Copper amine oxidase-like N-terminal domain-containing protein n=1 Tax=Paenibacillus glycanilyticus TaxID=126569 RepID=A0ABQ6GK20_9BACL|nr:hypothetical protein [Paenibacillus glycanilyticus]GLX70405.1 hypothetical protein MU1_47510 [Paenibacillus glycanilyticus]
MKKLVWITLIGAVSLVSMTTGAVAATTSTKIQAYLDGSIKFKINGAPWKPVDDKGKEIQPITYKGTTYLPVRAVSDAFQTPIKYDGASKTISIGAGDSVKFNSSAIKPKYQPWQFQDVAEKSQLTFGDKVYAGAYSMPAWSGSSPNDYMSFQFNAKYKTLHLAVSGTTDLKFQVANLEGKVIASGLTVSKGKVSEYDIDLMGSDGIIVYPYAGPATGDAKFYLIKDISWVK